MALRRQKLYRHSSTFYRKVKSQLNNIETNKFVCNANILASLGHTGNKISNTNINEFNNEENFSNTKEGSVRFCDKDFGETNFVENSEDSDQNENIISPTSLSLSKKILRWALIHRVSHSAINDLLQILITHGMKVLQDDQKLFLWEMDNFGITVLKIVYI